MKLFYILSVVLVALCFVHVATAQQNIWSNSGRNVCIRNPLAVIPVTSSMDDCKRRCDQYNGHTCQSISYHIVSRRCTLSQYNAATVPRGDWNTLCLFYSYAERLDRGVWTATQNACIRQRNNWSGRAVDMDACKLRCSNEANCCSVDFRNGLCHTSSYTQRTGAPAFTQPCYLPGFQYSERTDFQCTVLSSQWIPVRAACIRGRNNAIRTASNLQECQNLCLREGTFLCRSVDYKGTTCALSEFNRATASNDYTEPCFLAGWFYSERI